MFYDQEKELSHSQTEISTSPSTIQAILFLLFSQPVSSFSLTGLWSDFPDTWNILF